MRPSRLVPAAALLALIIAWGRHPAGWAALVLAVVLGAAVIAAVHHAEVLGRRVGEPFGSLLLAIAVTIIEVALIVALTVSSESNHSLARDTVFAAFMITTNAVVGAALLAATLRGSVASFQASGTGAMLATLTAVATLSLVLPNFTASTSGPTFTTGQLVFAAVTSLSLYLLFVFVQTVRHREQFEPQDQVDPAEEHDRPTGRQTGESLALLIAALVAVVGLAKTISTALEETVLRLGLPLTTVGVIIGLLIIAPEGITAVRSAHSGGDDVQQSFNLAYGSAMASIGLTIPVIAVVSIVFDMQLLLGLRPADMVLMALTIVVSVLTVTPGRATLLQAGVHLTIFAAYLSLAIMP